MPTTREMQNFGRQYTVFPDSLVLRTQNMIRGEKLFRNDLRGNKNYFELAGGSSYRGF